MCHVLSCQFVLTPPILLPVYWLICPTCLPSLPSSFAPFKISLCLHFRFWFIVKCHMPCVLSFPALPCLVQPCLACLPVCFSSTGLFLFVLFIIIIINKKDLFPPAIGSSLSSHYPYLTASLRHVCKQRSCPG